MKLSLNIYDENDEKIVRTEETEYQEISMGVIIDIFDVLKLGEEKEMSIWEMNLKLIRCYDHVRKILRKQFPNITDEEWRHVKFSEVASMLFNIVGHTLGEIKAIPTEKK